MRFFLYFFFKGDQVRPVIVEDRERAYLIGGSHVEGYFRGETFQRGRKFSIEEELDFQALFKK